MKITHVNYSFSTSGLPAGLVARHTDYVKASLALLFGITPDKINVSSKIRLPENAPFTLTCYSTRSESDAVAMVKAAKICLPDLEELRKLVPQNIAAIAAWIPGSSYANDLKATGLLAEGSVENISSSQQEWLASMSITMGKLNSTSGVSIQKQALAVFNALFSFKYKTPDRSKSAYEYDYKRVRVVLADHITTVSMSYPEYIRLIHQSKLQPRELNKVIGGIARELDGNIPSYRMSKAILKAFDSRLQASPN